LGAGGIRVELTSRRLGHADVCWPLRSSGHTFYPACLMLREVEGACFRLGERLSV